MQERGKRVEGVSLGEYQMQMCDSKVVEVWYCRLLQEYQVSGRRSVARKLSLRERQKNLDFCKCRFRLDMFLLYKKVTIFPSLIFI